MFLFRWFSGNSIFIKLKCYFVDLFLDIEFNVYRFRKESGISVIAVYGIAGLGLFCSICRRRRGKGSGFNGYSFVFLIFIFVLVFFY